MKNIPFENKNLRVIKKWNKLEGRSKVLCALKMSKRDLENVDNDDPLRKRLKIREKCMFGDKCYRRNPHHFRQFSHPHLECLKKEALENEPTIVKEQYQMLKELNLLDCDVKGKQPTLPMPTSSRTTVTKDMHPILQRFKSQEPFNIFFTKVKDVPSTHRDSNSIFLTDLLHSCHGNLKSSVQINFLVDFDWLFMSYEATGNQVSNIPSFEHPDNELSFSHFKLLIFRTFHCWFFTEKIIQAWRMSETMSKLFAFAHPTPLEHITPS